MTARDELDLIFDRFDRGPACTSILYLPVPHQTEALWYLYQPHPAILNNKAPPPHQVVDALVRPIGNPQMGEISGQLR